MITQILYSAIIVIICAQNQNSVTFRESIANISLANLLMALIIKNKPDIEKSEDEISIIFM